MTSSLEDGRAAALALLQSVEDACAQRLVPIPGGRAVLDARHPLLWDANHLRVEAAAPSPQELLAAAERHQSGLGRQLASRGGAAQRLYRRLGFVGAGLLPRFHRR